MGFYVHFSVVFSADHNESMVAAAQKQIDVFKNPDYKEGDYYQDKWDCEYDTIRFLEAIQDPKNYNTGPKGTLFSWGIVGNFTRVRDVVDDLKDFFIEAFTNDNINLYPHRHILFFQEREGSEQAQAYEIYLKQGSMYKHSKEDPELVVKHHDLPFAWMQM